MRYLPAVEAASHPALRKCSGADGLLWLDGAAHPHALFLRVCENPRCGCRDVNLRLLELTPEGEAGEGGLDVQAWVNIETCLVVRPPDLPPAERLLIQQVAAALPDGTLRELVEERESLVDATENLAQARIPVSDVLEGVLQSWLRHAAAGQHFMAGGRLAAGQVERDGRTWLLDVLYCPNPPCDCRSFYVLGYELVFESPDGPAELGEQFTVKGDIDTPHLEVTECAPKDRMLVRELVAGWLKANPQKRAAFRRQYREVREIGLRSLTWAGGRPRRDDDPRRKIGRNEKCPCGSGKKYKCCCGRTGP